MFHTSKDRTPYTYLIGWSNLNIWYYGRQASKHCHPSNFWVSYFTSSKHVKNFIKIHGNPDIIQIRKVFKTIKSCVKTEDKVLNKIYVSGSKNLWLNVNFQNGRINSTNKANAKDSITNEFLGKISLDDPRWKTKEIVGINKNKPLNQKQIEAVIKMGQRPKTEEHKRKISESLKGKLNNKGDKNPRFDPTVYHFVNLKTNEEFIGTRYDFFKQFPEISKGNISSVISGSAKQTKGWTIRIQSRG